MLFIFGGLPGTGKTELSTDLARKLGAVYLRIDTIERVLREPGTPSIGPEGYAIAYEVAADNLRLGLSVVADSANPLAITRRAWRETAVCAGSSFCEIEVICSDKREHRQRVESRSATIPGFVLPTWQDVIGRHYERWSGEHIVIDTAGQTAAQSKAHLIQMLRTACIEMSSNN
jgi:predicted kinase